MPKFTDTIRIRVYAGNGGAGAVSFRREKYIPKGGPDGGDGGTGGSVYIQSDRRYYNMSHLFKDKKYKAKKGSQGMGDNRHGKDGDDLVVKVPPGTQVIDSESGEILADLVEEGAVCLVAKGGIGGKGNAFFKSSTQQTPRFSQKGMPGEEKEIILNLKLIADVGLVGLPNAGKSTLLSRITKARPKIGDYPFTTLIPNLGVVARDTGKTYTIADIPGIIEGAHKGQGLGLSFLRHIERVSVILYLIDATEEDPLYNLQLLKYELETYNSTMLSKPSYVVLTKSDLLDADEISEKISLFENEHVLALSAVNGDNINELLVILDPLVERYNAT